MKALVPNPLMMRGEYGSKTGCKKFTDALRLHVHVYVVYIGSGAVLAPVGVESSTYRSCERCWAAAQRDLHKHHVRSARSCGDGGQPEQSSCTLSGPAD